MNEHKIGKCPNCGGTQIYWGNHYFENGFEVNPEEHYPEFEGIFNGTSINIVWCGQCNHAYVK